MPLRTFNPRGRHFIERGSPEISKVSISLLLIRYFELFLYIPNHKYLPPFSFPCSLMTKFSKKLVSKCVYVLILKNTETELVDMFMAEGGWTLIQTWLQDAVQTANWDLVREILGLLLVTPVDVERLKLNILPKLIKSLSRREELEGNFFIFN